MLKTRVMPCLLLQDEGLVKTVRFKKPVYVGDPINAVRIYNEMEVDELVFLDITASRRKAEPAYKLIWDIASECFMPFAYGGGIHSIEQIRKLFSLGVEKVIINSYAAQNPRFIKEASQIFGSQSIVVSIDARRNLFGKYKVYTLAGRVNTGRDPVQYARLMEEMGAGELLLTSIERDGTWKGYDTELIANVARAVSIPVVASGGAGKLDDLKAAVEAGGASALALGSMVVFQGKDLGVLIKFPTRKELRAAGVV